MIQPGLERIGQLLKNVHFPWKSIHVAGTNGKGSVCYYASKLITRRKIKCGKFTSPHLVDRWDCISINDKPVDEELFRKIEKHYIELSLSRSINASPFEILTATAFHIFNEEQVQIGVVEVGMGGKLDATNILNNQGISVISKIARDHEDFLGRSLEKIAAHKAGILRPNVPYIVNASNERNVKNVIDEYATKIGAGPCLDLHSPVLDKKLFSKEHWKNFAAVVRPAERGNVQLAVFAAKTVVESLGLEYRPFDIGKNLWKQRLATNPGRLELIKVPPVFGDPRKVADEKKGSSILVDGAHNPDAARVLDDTVQYTQRRRKILKGKLKAPRNGWPVTWVLAMTEGKDAHAYLEVLLRPGDNVITTTFGPVDGMPWVKPMDPKELLDIARSVRPEITGIAIPEHGVLRALCAARYMTEPDRPIVLTGSLYLVGDFHREFRPVRGRGYWTEPEFEDHRRMCKELLAVERSRVNRSLSYRDADPFGQDVQAYSTIDMQRKEKKVKEISEREKRQKLQAEVESLNQEMESLAEQERRLSQSILPDATETENSPSTSPDTVLSSSDEKSASEEDNTKPHTPQDDPSETSTAPGSEVAKPSRVL